MSLARGTGGPGTAVRFKEVVELWSNVEVEDRVHLLRLVKVEIAHTCGTSSPAVASIDFVASSLTNDFEAAFRGTPMCCRSSRCTGSVGLPRTDGREAADATAAAAAHVLAATSPLTGRISARARTRSRATRQAML